ncbi:MAG: hypothetical protein ACOCYP_03575 [Planctomycetota bacterium]
MGLCTCAVASIVAAESDLVRVELYSGRFLVGRYLAEDSLMVTCDPTTGRSHGVIKLRPDDVIAIEPFAGPRAPDPVASAPTVGPAPAPAEANAPAMPLPELRQLARQLTAQLDDELDLIADYSAIGEINALAKQLKTRSQGAQEAARTALEARRQATALAQPALAGLFTQLATVLAGRARYFQDQRDRVVRYTRFIPQVRESLEAARAVFAQADQMARQHLAVEQELQDEPAVTPPPPPRDSEGP